MYSIIIKVSSYAALTELEIKRCQPKGWSLVPRDFPDGT